jgi:hypothetical protein
MDDNTPQQELPRYKCHKQVWALKIAQVTPIDGGAAIITPTDGRYAPFEVDAAYCTKHQPQVGGYFVQYKGGYKSWSPAEAFEAGYTRIQGASNGNTHERGL